MRILELTKRNLRETWRDPLSLFLAIGLPAALLLVLQAFGGVNDSFKPTFLAPGIALFGFVMLMFSSALILSRDRESALFTRLLTTPLRSNDFAAAYSTPYFVVAVVQVVMIFAIAAALGLEMAGNVALVGLVMLVMAVFYIALGMIVGALFTVKQVPFLYTVVLLLTIFGGAWMDLEEIGGIFQRVGDAFPFAHALDAVRAVMIDGADLGAITTDLYWVLGYTAAITGLAVLAFRRRMVE